MFAEALLASALVGLASSTIYSLLAAAATRRFRAIGRARSNTSAARRALPPLSVLKPVHGAERLLEECLESFFQQRYAEFELIFGGRRRDDPAWDIVNKLRAKYPQIKTQIVISGNPIYPNAKVSALETMVGRASFPYLVIADSDAHVGPDCLAGIVRPLHDSGVGLVTCLYRGVPIGGLCSRFEALGMSVEMTSGVLVEDMIDGMRSALGPTTATRLDVLETIGGIGSLGDYCADDYVLGQRIHATGKRVVLSEHVIEHVAVNRSFRASMQHQMRWMRSTRFSRPWGHVGTGLTFALPYGILGCAAAVSLGRVQLATALMCCAVANRVLQCLVVGWGAVRDRKALRYCWLYPARDLVGFFVWCGSFLGTGIVWRDERYGLTAGGRLRRRGLAVDVPIARAADARMHPDAQP